MEKELLAYVQQKWKEINAVTSSMIRRKAKELGKALNIENSKFSREDMPLIVRNFLQIAREKTANIEKKFILFIDETPIWFDMPHNTILDFEGVRNIPIKTTRNDKLHFTVVLGYIASGEKLSPTGVIFVNHHSSHIHDDVIKVLNTKGLDIVKFSGGTTFVLQPPDVSIDEEKDELTARENHNKASYELVSEWVSQTWKEIGTNILTRSFEVARLTLNLDDSEDDKMSSYFQAIIANCKDKVTFDEEDQNNEFLNEEDQNNKSPNKEDSNAQYRAATIIC
ncbi:19881_t:CDS:2 [Dentiscutata erythropus]|uniref:19881_t:CDS:1 n=1 Tax=Dentiscutata erythropus TaxID=1348616 RepID=A0A9N9BN97_9GLOM|nr:19881_t:CDS:2 [Dentiscutata erythropus]